MGRARSEAFTLHQTGLGTVPSPVKLYSVNGALDPLKMTKKYAPEEEFVFDITVFATLQCWLFGDQVHVHSMIPRASTILSTLDVCSDVLGIKTAPFLRRPLMSSAGSPIDRLRKWLDRDVYV